MIYISSDHGGFELKNYLVAELLSRGLEVTDLGPSILDPNDDYPDYAKLLAQKVLENPQNKGILLCRNGVGIGIAANKFKGIRAALSWNTKHAESTRTDDDSNVLVLPADYVSREDAVDIAQNWLSTPFSNEDRHIRRLSKLSSLEEN